MINPTKIRSQRDYATGQVEVRFGLGDADRFLRGSGNSAEAGRVKRNWPTSPRSARALASKALPS